MPRWQVWLKCIGQAAVAEGLKAQAPTMFSGCAALPTFQIPENAGVFWEVDRPRRSTNASERLRTRY